MSTDKTLTISAIGLIIIGIAMIVIGLVAHILPPPLTGVGFLIIAFVFLKLRKKE